MHLEFMFNLLCVLPITRTSIVPTPTVQIDRHSSEYPIILSTYNYEAAEESSPLFYRAAKGKEKMMADTSFEYEPVKETQKNYDSF